MGSGAGVTDGSKFVSGFGAGGTAGIGGTAGSVGMIAFSTLIGYVLDWTEKLYGKPDYLIPFIIAGSAYLVATLIIHLLLPRLEPMTFDTDTEPTEDICKKMAGYVTDSQVKSDIILNRAQAIENAAAVAKSHPERLDVILAIGKGNERWIKRLNRHTPYEGDDAVLARVLG